MTVSFDSSRYGESTHSVPRTGAVSFQTVLERVAAYPTLTCTARQAARSKELVDMTKVKPVLSVVTSIQNPNTIV